MALKAVTALATVLLPIGKAGIAVAVRSAHETNGSCYAWGQQAQAYVHAFRTVSAGLKDALDATSLMRAPNYVGGYPFAGGSFKARYGEKLGKPVAIPETAALVVDSGDVEGELVIKQAWWRPVFAADTPAVFPQLMMIEWFERRKTEPEVGGEVDRLSRQTGRRPARSQRRCPAGKGSPPPWCRSLGSRPPRGATRTSLGMAGCSAGLVGIECIGAHTQRKGPDRPGLTDATDSCEFRLVRASGQ